MILNGMIKTVVVIAAVVLAVYAGAGAFRHFSKSMKTDKSIADIVLAQNWQKKEIEGTGITILAPDMMKDVSHAADIADNVTAQSVHQFSLDTFGLTVLSVETSDGLNGEAFTNDLVNKIKNSGAADSFQYEIKPLQKSNISGWLLQGAANARGQKIVVEALSFSNSRTLKHIAISYDGNEEKLGKLASRILDSVEIE
jgi:hypothetical protein